MFARMRFGIALSASLLMLFMVLSRISMATEPSVKEFHLYATDGWVTMPDGVKIYIWGFSDKNEVGSATLPGPALQVNQGDRVRLTMTNIGPSVEGAPRPNHTIHLHGLDVDQENDGVGHTSHEVAHGNSFTYSFTATHAGTYWYHCHVDPTDHIQMGMYGAIVVMPSDGSNRAWNGGPAFDRQVTMLLSEMDPVWHSAIHGRKPFDRTEFHPRYWLINGKAAPDTMYDLDAVVKGEVGEKVLVRLVNAGYQWHAMHMHGFHFDVIASDGRPLPAPWVKDTISIAPGERYDLLVTLDQRGIFPFHDHSEVHVTNNGRVGDGGMGGMHTMVYSGMPLPTRDDHSHGGWASPPATPHAGHGGGHSQTETGSTPSSPQSSAYTPGVQAELRLGSTEAKVDGKVTTLVAAPELVDGRIFMPMQALGDLLGAELRWDPEQQSGTYTRAGTNVQVWIGENVAKVNGQDLVMSAPPVLLNGSAYVPLSVVSEALGGKIGLVVPDQPISVTIPPTARVVLRNMTFQPSELVVPVGTVVTWENQDSMTLHNVKGSDWDSGYLGVKQTFSRTFNTPGAYDYVCDLHVTMIGQIVVQ